MQTNNKYICNKILSHTGCVEINTAYSGNDINKIPDPDAITEKLCQKACQRDIECEWWTLDLFSWNPTEKGCHLKMKRDSTKRRVQFGAVSGPKICREYFLKTKMLTERFIL